MVHPGRLSKLDQLLPEGHKWSELDTECFEHIRKLLKGNSILLSSLPLLQLLKDSLLLLKRPLKVYF